MKKSLRLKSCSASRDACVTPISSSSSSFSVPCSVTAGVRKKLLLLPRLELSAQRPRPALPPSRFSSSGSAVAPRRSRLGWRSPPSLSPRSSPHSWARWLRGPERSAPDSPRVLLFRRSPRRPQGGGPLAVASATLICGPPHRPRAALLGEPQRPRRLAGPLVR